MLTDPKLRSRLEEARADVAAGRVSGLDELTAKVEAKLWGKRQLGNSFGDTKATAGVLPHVKKYTK